MLIDLKGLKKQTLHATDGEMGRIDDVYFDEDNWMIRYFVVDTNRWLPGRRVVLSPKAFHANQEVQEPELTADLTKEQIKGAPSWDTAKPLSRQQEEKIHEYYGWYPYWMTTGSITSYVETVRPQPMREIDKERSGQGTADPSLRSAHAVEGYRIKTVDGTIGHAEDFVLDTHGWSIRYLIVDTKNWLPGRKVLVASDWISDMNFDETTVYVALVKEMIKNSPEYDPKALNREYENKLYDYYGKGRYWQEAPDTRKNV